ncbi:phenylalanine--tRNA ligase subunit beta [candidate division WWE3 bacterium CG09_land_8_20_14_0_10_47_33]|nr:MAG: phenylalanine--tRNA ligase subunit beta [candidate division WWE3 bacterium CG09_land_8_20_14_0_10_47_33]PJE52338.1 MAG: phenylalanine--tRNA ligase subunit beta [candidate division WWE3 bacterium CG10_big_fil_rev_8_21_14_0_10_48_23]
MLIPYAWLKEFVKLKASAEVVGEELSLATIGVEEVRREGGEAILNLEVTYNRGDLLSILGVARELAALYNLNLQKEEEEFKPPANTQNLVIKSDKDLCSLYTLVLIKGFSCQETPNEIKKRLRYTGMRPVNLLADITNYVMLEYGQPLHAFDAEKIKKRDPSMSIEVRNAKRGEVIKTLDGLTRILEPSDTVIADRKGPIAIGGVMGGKDTEVEVGTKEVLLEAAIFNPIAIRRTSRRLGLRSEASIRFEHYLSPENLLKALNRAIKLYHLHGSGEVGGFGQIGKTKTTPEPVNLDATKLNSLLGTEITITEARQHLTRLRFKVMSSTKGLIAWPPHFRGDIKHEEDLIEEVARLHGYDDLPATAPCTIATDTPENIFEYLRNNLSKLLAGMGFNEVKTYPFLTTEALVHKGSGGLLKLRNPVSSEAEYLKDSDLLNILNAARVNTPRCKEGRLFELEKVYPKEGEYFALTALLWGIAEPYRTLKGVLEALLTKTHLNCDFAPAKDNLLHPGRTAKIIVNNKNVGIIGEVHPHLAKSYSLTDTALFELNLESLAKYARRWGIFTLIPPYPEVYEDFSFFFPYGKQLGPLVQKIKTLNEVIRGVELADLFEREGKRSVTLRLTFQSSIRELSSKDLKPVRRKITGLIKKSGGELRG